MSDGIVDEHSLEYATLGLTTLCRDNDITSYHIEADKMVPEMMSSTLQNSLGITEADFGRIWHKVSSPGEFQAAINTVACAILEDLQIP